MIILIVEDHTLELTCAGGLLVFLEQDSSITVAFDDVPEDGLNSPLRLEKLANEV